MNSGVCCRHGIDRHAEWGYWNEIDLSPDIVKVQRRPAPGTYASHNSDRAMFGILDNGIFWAGRDDDTFGAGYSYGNQFQEDFRDRPDVFYLNATWRGDAFGMEKTTRKFVAGPASLTLESVTRPRFGLPNFDWHLGVSFKNIGADPIDMRFRAGGAGFGVYKGENKGFVLEGKFMGPDAQEAVGIFDNDRYYGSFGLQRVRE